MRALLDVNLLIALIDEQHVHHLAAHTWWSANRSMGWASCPITQNGFLRVLTQPQYPNALTFADAFDLLTREIGEGDHEFWPDDQSLLDSSRFDRAHIFGPRQLTDIYLLALAVTRDGCLATIDSSIPLAAVYGAEAKHLAIVKTP